MKPFKPPTLVARTPSSFATLTSSEPPAKRRRISDDSVTDHDEVTAAAAEPLKKWKPPQQQQAAVRRPLDVIKNPSGSSQSSQSDRGDQSYYTVLWRNPTTKKHKTWDGDGVLSLSGGHATLQDISGRGMGRTACKGPLLVGSELSVGGKSVEVESMISREDFLAGRPFLKTTQQAPTKQSLKPIDAVDQITFKDHAKQDKIVAAQKARPNGIAPPAKASNAAFKNPMLANTVQRAARRDAIVPVPRHDPTAENALVMKRPRNVPAGKHVVDVVIDPLLTKNLREHQRAGVAFLYECVMGMKDYSGEGAILADEMGLGKTLQTIALLWTLLKQNPIHEAAPVIKKALIVCPVTLVDNWRREFRKWLGNERIGVFVVDDKKRLTDFTKGKAYSVMIIGYEKLRMVQSDLQKGSGIDIVIADEGHRLKTKQNKSALAIKSLNTERRIILSGTPIQNDLTEFYTMVDFVNPGLLDKYTAFKRDFETPILKSRQPSASAKDVENGKERSEELAHITGKFILRRTAEILSEYLPSKTEYVVFCRPTPPQAAVYRAIIASPTFNAALGSPAISLELINILKKVCNSPTLLTKKNDKGEDRTKPELLEAIPPALLKSPAASVKIQVLDSLLYRIRKTTEEKVVLVSNYTATMDVLATLLNSLEYKYLRLDGSTPASKRQDLVDSFNRSPPSKSFVFLLSAKAGGTGLNLIGASRLVLFDLDWNPATDLQAMARVHRDGQKRRCFIYRFLTQGALDEKIFQRQVSKTGLADSIVDGKSATSGFSREELRDLFSLDEGDDCQTHKSLGCVCGGRGVVAPEAVEEAEEERNDLASLSASPKRSSEETVETIRLDQDSDDEPIRPKFRASRAGELISAKKAEALLQAESVTTTKKREMLSLMQYTHFDTRLIGTPKVDESVTVGSDDDEPMEPSLDPLDSAIEDDVLKAVLREDGNRVGYIFTKSSF